MIKCIYGILITFHHDFRMNFVPACVFTNCCAELTSEQQEDRFLKYLVHSINWALAFVSAMHTLDLIILARASLVEEAVAVPLKVKAPGFDC